jgi:hypothetical protein
MLRIIRRQKKNFSVVEGAKKRRKRYKVFRARFVYVLGCLLMDSPTSLGWIERPMAVTWFALNIDITFSSC